MPKPISSRWTMLMVLISLAAPRFAQAQQGEDQMAGGNMAEMKFAPVPGLPTCAPGAVQTGDPTKGASVILARVAAGCVIPWHWHTPNEHLMIVSGVVRLETRDGKPLTLQEGGFAKMPGRHVHQFRCTTACVLFVYSDATLDIHYVDASGRDISPEEALKAVKEHPATAMN